MDKSDKIFLDNYEKTLQDGLMKVVKAVNKIGDNLLSSPDIDEKWEQFRSEADLRAAAAKRAAEKNGAFFLPLQADFEKALEIQPAGYWIGDGVHPTIAGHQLIADKWLKLFSEKIYPIL